MPAPDFKLKNIVAHSQSYSMSQFQNVHSEVASYVHINKDALKQANFCRVILPLSDAM